MEVLKKLHVSIAEAFEASFDDAYKNLETQLAIREAELTKAKIDASKANDARQIAEQRMLGLQCNIAALQKELNLCKTDPLDLELPAKYANIEAEFDPSRVWDRDVDDVYQLRQILETRYTALYEDLQAFIQSWASLKSKVLQHKKKLQHWDKQLQRDEFTLVLHGAPVTFQKVQRSEAENTTKDTRLSTSSLAPQAPPNSEISDSLNSATTLSSSMPNKGRSADLIAKPNIEQDNRQMSSSHQQDPEPTQSPNPDTESSQMSPDARQSLPKLQKRKRKRGMPSYHTDLSEDNTEQPVRVKSEPVSSSPVQHSGCTLEQPFPSTQDLDDIGDAVQTPTKRHAWRGVQWKDSVASESSRALGQSSVLQPVDGNARNRKPSDQLLGNKKPKSTGQRAIRWMAEDGDARDGSSHSHPSSTSAFTAPSEAKVKAESTQARLQSLLDGPAPHRSPLGSSKSAHGSNAIHRPREDITPTRNRRTAQSTYSPQHTNRSTEPAALSDPDVHPEDEPYRSRPLHRQTLEHFKINPARNQGLDFAYHAVVRRKDDRKCLAGCTRPGCCGDRFRAMARVGGLPAKCPAEQAVEDQRILEEYVGDDQNLLNGLNAQERANLLVEARARAIANQYGRHRHSHQRARTPPGFWRTNMPSTQELESDREAARRLDREKVEERYREAMRPGGLWTWADE